MQIRKLLLGIAIVTFLAAAAGAQATESLYVNTSASSRPITSETNSHGAPDGAETSISGKLARMQETWTFDFDSTSFAGVPILSAEIFITHRQSGYSNDSLVLEYVAGTSFIPFESFSNVPTTLTTVGPFATSAIVDNLNGTGVFDWTPDLTQAGVYNVTFFSSAINRSPGLFRTADSKTSNGTENTGRPAANQSLGANDGTTRIT